MSVPRGFKAGADRIALGLRHQMYLPNGAPIDPDALAATLGFPIVPISTFADVFPEHVAQLVEGDTGAFSASLLQLNPGRIILVNDGHSLRRRNSNIAHEIAHAILAHVPQPFDHIRGHSFNKDIEDEANCLAGHILIPDAATMQIVWSGCSKDAACERYGVSRQMLEYRLNTSGARIRRDRLRQHR